MRFLLSLTLPLVCSLNAFASSHNAPAGIMGDHLHKKGEVMGMYSASYSSMRGIYDMTESEALAQYGQSPHKMRMRMLMAMGMYGVTDNFNIMVMGHFMDMNMTSFMKMGMMTHSHEHETSGIGDVEISGLYKIFDDGAQKAQANLGLILPTGSIDEKHNDHGTIKRMSYMMQLGSGSYSLRPQFSWGKRVEQYEFGTQIGGTFRLNKNSNDYKLGNVYNTTAWAVRNIDERFGVTSRVNYTQTGNVDGADSTLDTSSTATNNPKFQHRKQLDALLGFNVNIANNVKVLLEGGVPIYQETGKGMMKNRYSVNLALQHSL
jgi:hypothetical protein